MDKNLIKIETEKNYKQIAKSQARLEELRSICKHEKTYEGNYSWRIGAMQLAEICEYCGEMIRYIE